MKSAKILMRRNLELDGMINSFEEFGFTKNNTPVLCFDASRKILCITDDFAGLGEQQQPLQPLEKAVYVFLSLLKYEYDVALSRFTSINFSDL
jgi:hypothetical protein